MGICQPTQIAFASQPVRWECKDTILSICHPKNTIEEDTPLEDIAALMTEKGATLLPVLQGDKLVGIVGKTDVLRTISSSSI